MAVAIREPGRSELSVLVGDSELEVGRDCRGVLLTDPQISRRHLTLQATGAGVRVVDRSSTNGTRVDDQVLTAPRVLRPGQIVRLGATTIVVLGADQDALPAGGPLAALRATSIELVAAAAASDPPDVAELRALSDDAGTITIVFSDIENSTRTAVGMGDPAWVRLLQVHDSIVRRNVSRHGGTEIKAQGDGFMLSFPSARRAVGAMVDVQRALAAHSRSHPTEALRVRVGIHTGEVIVGDDGDLFGRHVILASRVAGSATGGEIVVSALVHELLEPRDEFRFGVARTVPLKGIEMPQRLYPVKWDDATTLHRRTGGASAR